MQRSDENQLSLVLGRPRPPTQDHPPPDLASAEALVQSEEATALSSGFSPPREPSPIRGDALPWDASPHPEHQLDGGNAFLG
jgi:hypothetical protein